MLTVFALVAFALPPGGWVDGPRWAGSDWSVRHSDAAEGAGPNRWSARGVRVRAEALELRLRPERDGVRSAEAASALLPEHVEVSFEVTWVGPRTRVVFGAFLYRDDRREYDHELGRWGRPFGPGAQFAGPGFRRPFRAGPGRTRHTLRIEEERVTFTTAGEFGVERAVIERRDDAEAWRLHFNLWLLEGRGPGFGIARVERLTVLALAAEDAGVTPRGGRRSGR